MYPLSDVATKKDLSELRRELREEMARVGTELRHEISSLRSQMISQFRWIIGLIIVVWGTTVIPLLMKIAGII